MYGASKAVNQSSFTDNFAFFRILYNYFRRINPAKDMYENISASIKSILTANHKLRMSKYRVNQAFYRLNQMERLIEHNNPENFIAGRKLNQLR